MILEWLSIWRIIVLGPLWTIWAFSLCCNEQQFFEYFLPRALPNIVFSSFDRDKYQNPSAERVPNIFKVLIIKNSHFFQVEVGFFFEECPLQKKCWNLLYGRKIGQYGIGEISAHFGPYIKFENAWRIHSSIQFEFWSSTSIKRA